MCTAIGMNNGNFYFGRNMDLDYDFGEDIVIVPRNFPLTFRKACCADNHYAVMGMAVVRENYPLFGEAVNEHGLCMAGLNFPDNACYCDNSVPGKYSISPFELIPWVLGRCRNTMEAERLLAETSLSAIPFGRDIPLSPLHWMISDKYGSLAAEPMKEGLRVHRNPVNVLTNNPPFEFHLQNLSQYLNLHTNIPENCFSEKGIVPFGKGTGSIGLPGDWSSASRFIRAAYLLCNSICNKDEESCVSQIFHILGSVAVVSGAVECENNRRYCTVYSSCINAAEGIYYYKTYGNSRITAVRMKNANLDSEKVIAYGVERESDIKWVN